MGGGNGGLWPRWGKRGARGVPAEAEAAVDLPPRLAALTESTGARIGGFVALVTSPPDAR